MAHSHDKTMIARLGFADADKRGGLHDDLCAFLTSKDIAVDIVRMVAKRHKWFEPKPCLGDRIVTEKKGNGYPEGSPYYATRDFPVQKPCGSALECTGFWGPTIALETPITKGHGPYMTTVGFLDVHLHGLKKGMECDHCGESEWGLPNICIEVKAGRVSPAELLRQIKFYRDYMPDAVWVAFTGFRYSADDAALLEREGITVLAAGPKFKAWQEARSSAPADGGAEL